MSVDFLSFGPHPDDAEIGTGAVLHKVKSLGHTAGIIDMTTGDMGWGTPEERLKECDQAAEVLGLQVRENLRLGDCRIEDTFENRCAAAAAIRRHRPQVVFAPYYDLPIGRGLGHNDHYKTGQIVANAYNLAHLRKAPIPGEAYQAKAIFYYFVPPGTQPTFIVDITDHIEPLLAALACHKSQFANPDRPRPDHLPSFREWMERYLGYWGWQIGARFGQPFLATGPLKVGDPLDLVKDVIPRV